MLPMVREEIQSHRVASLRQALASAGGSGKTLLFELKEHPSAFLSITSFMPLSLLKGEKEVLHGKHGVKLGYKYLGELRAS